MIITNLISRKIIDSRNNTTVEVDLTIDNEFVGRASVPGGKSVGKYEKKTTTPDQAKKDIDTIIKDSILNNKKFTSIEIMDEHLKSIKNLGANAILPVSIAFAKAIARKKNLSLFRTFPYTPTLPTPMFNVLNGGAHATNETDIQEFMLVPMFNSFEEKIWNSSKIISTLQNILREKSYSCSVGDEGGFAPSLSTTEALELLTQSIEMSGFIAGKDFHFALDVAVSHLYKNNKYYIDGMILSRTQLVNYYAKLVDKYPIFSLEDPMDESDLEGWIEITKKLKGKTILIGDDLFVTNVKYLEKGVADNMGDGVIIKPNQIGTVSDTLATLAYAKKHNYKTVISHRSGETEDTFISHLAVGADAKYIKAGCLIRGERTSKYNELLRISQQFPEENLVA